MAVRRVLMLGDPELREESSMVVDYDSGLRGAVRDLKDTLRHVRDMKGMGRGIAAPQLGIPMRMIYIETDDRSLVMVNPKVIWRSEEHFEVWDSCFSFDLQFFVKVDRSIRIKVEFFNEDGEEMTEDFKGDLSELIQHEIDHLDGILATDRLKDPRNILMRSEWEKRYR